jgi:PAS domain S-box-containing protein
VIRSQAVPLQPPLLGNRSPHLIISAHGGRILAADEESARLTGYTVEELEALRLGDLLGRQEYPEVMAFLEHSLLSGRGELGGIHIHGKDGVPRSVALTVEAKGGTGSVGTGPTSLSQGLYWPSTLHCFLEDVTERELIGQELEQGKQALSGLRTLADTVTAQPPRLVQVLEGALAQILHMLALEMGGIYVTERRDPNEPLVLRVVQGVRAELMESQATLSPEDALLRRLTADGRRDPRTSQPESFLVRERVSPSSDLLPGPWLKAGVCAFMAQLLGTSQKPCGLLLVGASQPHRFSSRDRDLLELSSHQLSMAVENGLLLQELTERVEDLSAMRQLSASVLRDMSDGLLTVDVEGKITSFNPAAEGILGCPASQAQGQLLASLLGEDSDMATLVRKGMDEGISYSRRELVMRRADGRPVPVGASVALLRTGLGGVQSTSRDDERQVSGAVVVFTDLTEEKNAEEERRHQDRLALLGEMTAVLAHEVRNPLAGIVHGIQYVAEELSLEGEAAQSARFILEESRRISRLLDDILLISRPHQLELVPCDLPAILERLLYYWRAQAAARGIEVYTGYSRDLSAPLGDPVRLEQVFANLISNALDAMPEGGTLWLRVRPAQLVSAVPGQNPRTAVRVEVEDTGVGIPAHALHRVYESFFTTKEKGTGLGLPIAQRIVQDHQGKIEVHSEEGKGTLFTVILPLEEAEVYEPQVHGLSS